MNDSIKIADHPGGLSSKEHRAEKRENVRSQIALYYVVGFLIIIFISLFIGLFQNFKVDDYKDILLTISGILSGPLGFIIGFYFKESTETDAK